MHTKLAAANLPEDTYDTLIEHLTFACHGSGFDGEWSIRRFQNGKYRTQIGYHCMNRSGYYDGWIVVNCHYSGIGALEKVTFSADAYHRRHYITCQTDYFWDTVPFDIPVLELGLAEVEVGG